MKVADLATCVDSYEKYWEKITRKIMSNLKTPKEFE